VLALRERCPAEGQRDEQGGADQHRPSHWYSPLSLHLR
jgi:hypothetical protein